MLYRINKAGLFVSGIEVEYETATHRRKTLEIKIGLSLPGLCNLMRDGVLKNLKLGRIVHLDGGVTLQRVNKKIEGDTESETYDTYLLTSSALRTIMSNQKTHKNPDCSTNSECEFCHKPSVKLYKDNLIDETKKAVRVCIRCKNGPLKIGHKIEARRKLNA